MAYLVGMPILFLVVIGVLFVLSLAHKESSTNSRGVSQGGFNARPWQVLTAGCALVLFVIITAVCSTDQVQTNHIGIKKQFGAFTGQPTGDSLVFHAPWQSITQVSIQDEKRTYKMGSVGINTGNTKVDVTGGSAVSKDSQAISLFVQVNYALQKDHAVHLVRQTGGQYLQRILDAAVFQHAKSQTASYTATEFAANREKVRQSIQNSLSRALEPSGITVKTVSLLDVGYSPGLAAAIEKTVEARQQAIAAEARVKIVRAEAQQRVAEAQGRATAAVTEAKGASEAQKLRQKTLTPLLVQEEAINALNPDVKVIVCPPHTNCVPQAVIATADAGSATQAPAPAGKSGK